MGEVVPGSRASPLLPDKIESWNDTVRGFVIKHISRLPHGSREKKNSMTAEQMRDDFN